MCVVDVTVGHSHHQVSALEEDLSDVESEEEEEEEDKKVGRRVALLYHMPHSHILTFTTHVPSAPHSHTLTFTPHLYPSAPHSHTLTFTPHFYPSAPHSHILTFTPLHPIVTP